MKAKNKVSKTQSRTTEEQTRITRRSLRRNISTTSPSSPRPVVEVYLDTNLNKTKRACKNNVNNSVSSTKDQLQKIKDETKIHLTSNHLDTYSRTWPEIVFEKSKINTVNCNPHLWPLQHDCSKNIFHFITNSSIGRLSYRNKQSLEKSSLSTIGNYDVFTAQQPYQSRITSIEWHPRINNYFCIGSKHGDLGFFRLDYEDRLSWKPSRVKSYNGIGPGGYISAMKFHPTENNQFYTSSLDGKVCHGDLEKDTEHGQKVFLNTCTWERWFCSLDVNNRENFIAAGSNVGHTHLLSRMGETIWEKRLHNQKVSHLEFSPCESHLLCSASLDHTVRIWDLRMIDEKKPLACLHHEKGINSAYFSLTDGTRLLTTDQGDNMHIYRAPFWHLETDIRHPHRFFQHITPIKAQWHPFTDIVMCGRFPDERNYSHLGDKRAIDFFDASLGEMVLSLKNVYYNNITSLCKFNNTGNVLLTAMGYNMLLWSASNSYEVSDDNSGKDIKKPKTSLAGFNSKTNGKSKRDWDKKSLTKLNVTDKRKIKDAKKGCGGKKQKRN
ncbi:DNA damage-binding protein 2 [Bulinus truncatus]|nr:DNA damage-binding protein 2 [Bulinus truncatus]